MRHYLIAALLVYAGGLAACGGARMPDSDVCKESPAFIEGTPVPDENPKSDQAVQVNRFCGTITIDGQPAPDGTAVEAVVEGAVCGSGQTEDDSYYVAVPEGLCGASGETVFFLVGAGGGLAAEPGQLIRSAADHPLDLTVETEPAIPRPAPEPFTFQGSVTVDGEPAADGSLVEIVGGCGVGLTGGGRYAIRGYPKDYRLGGRCGCGSTVRFAVNGRATNENGSIGCPLGGGEVNLTVGE